MAAYETTATLKACAHTTGLTASKGSPRASGSSVRFVSIGAATATVDELRDDADACMGAGSARPRTNHRQQGAQPGTPRGGVILGFVTVTSLRSPR